MALHTCMAAWLHLASRGAVVALHLTGLTKRESERDGLGLVAIFSSPVPMASQIFLFFLFLFFSWERNQIDKFDLLHSKFITMTLC
jgi:hypothetical protein